MPWLIDSREPLGTLSPPPGSVTAGCQRLCFLAAPKRDDPLAETLWAVSQ